MPGYRGIIITRTGDLEVDDELDVGVVVSHCKSRCGHDNLELVSRETFFGVEAVFRLALARICLRIDTQLLEEPGNSLGV